MSVPLSARPALRSVCRACRQELQRHPHNSSQVAPLSTSTSHQAANPKYRVFKGINQLQIQSNQRDSDPEKELPRWLRTPQAMKAPVRIRPMGKNSEYQVNEDPAVLNEAYVNMLGRGGEDVLPEELKWLAITHKSFDHGRRGFNDRLALFGKRIVDLQASLAMLDSPKVADAPAEGSTDKYGRVAFTHPSLSGIHNVTEYKKKQTLTYARIGRVASVYGFDKVVRWKPRQVDKLRQSGLDVVLTSAMYAIVGAIASQRGGEEAAQVAIDKILRPLGFR